MVRGAITKKRRVCLKRRPLGKISKLKKRSMAGEPRVASAPKKRERMVGKKHRSLQHL